MFPLDETIGMFTRHSLVFLILGGLFGRQKITEQDPVPNASPLDRDSFHRNIGRPFPHILQKHHRVLFLVFGKGPYLQRVSFLSVLRRGMRERRFCKDLLFFFSKRGGDGLIPRFIRRGYDDPGVDGRSEPLFCVIVARFSRQPVGLQRIGGPPELKDPIIINPRPVE